MYSSNLRAAVGVACLLFAIQGCRRVETEPHRAGSALAIAYSANIMGEIEPCG